MSRVVADYTFAFDATAKFHLLAGVVDYFVRKNL